MSEDYLSTLHSLVFFSQYPESYKSLARQEATYVEVLAQMGPCLDKYTPDIVVLDFVSLGLNFMEPLLALQDTLKTKTRASLLILDEAQLKSADTEQLASIIQHIVVYPYCHEELQLSLELLGRDLDTLETSQNSAEVARSLFQIVAHDISNLLTNFEILLSSIDRGKSQEMIEKRQRRARITMSEVKQMLKNVKLMDSFESHTLHLQKQSVRVADCLEKLCEIYAERLETKELKIEIQWDTAKEAVVSVDEVSFKHQVLGNLLSNAIKFSYPKGTIFIRVFDRDNFTAVSIQDHGMGMPQDVMNTIFDGRKSVSRQGTSGEQGTGFGVPLVYKFVKSFNGQIEVESLCEDQGGKQRGSTFTVLMPRGN